MILNSVPYKKLNSDLDYRVDPDIVVSGARELEIMEAERIEKGHFVS